MSTVQKSFQRRFVLDRKQDATGTSGTGIVAEGIMFSNGKVALTWFSHYGAVNVYDSIEVVRGGDDRRILREARQLACGVSAMS